MSDNLRVRLRKRLGRVAFDTFFQGSAWLSSLGPWARPQRYDIEVVRDVAYGDSGKVEHRLDIYRPAGPKGRLPVVLYVHGGSFRILSKDSHWIMGLIFARRGYLVVNINYRLAPQHPFPAALEDTCEAYRWLLEHGPEYGADIDRLVFAGESAGANLITALTLCLCYQRTEHYAQKVWQLGRLPCAVMPACGVFQVSEPERFAEDGRWPDWALDRLSEVSEAYLPRHVREAGTSLDLADPLLVLERGEQPARLLPPFFLGVGTRDPLIDDTRRMSRALARLQTACQDEYYEREMHAFHAFVWRPAAKHYWHDAFAFLERYVRQPLSSPATPDGDAPSGA
jgi:acetyl esterase